MKIILLLFLICYVGSINFLDYRHPMPVENLEETSTTTTHMEGYVSGKGYSNLKESLSSTVCYSPYPESETGHYSEVDFTKAQSYNQLSKALGIDIELKGGYGYFTGSLGAGFSKEVMQTSTNISLNFFAKSSYRVNINYPYGADSLLTSSGKKALNTGLEFFADVCGDYVISQIEKGSALVMSLVLEFFSEKERNQFKLKLGVGVLGIVELSTKINLAVQETRIDGNIKIKAIQLGGDPSQLSSIIGSNIKDCNFINFENCIEIAKRIIEYGSKDYPNQLLDKSKHIPLGSFNKVPASNFGIKKIPPVNMMILEAREWFIDLFKKIDYYNLRLNKLSQFPKASSENLDKLKDFAETIRDVYDRLKGDDGGKVCWKSSRNCLEYKEEFENDLKDLFEEEDELVESISKMRYAKSFILNFSKGSNTCRVNSTWISSQTLKILYFTTPEGNQIFTINNEITQGHINSTGEIILKINRDKYSYIVETIKLKYHESNSIISGSAFCTDANVQHAVDIQGRKFTVDFYLEKYDESLTKYSN